MFYWIIPVVFIAGLIVWMLLRALKQFEHENAAIALERATELENRLNALEDRISVLETIESNTILDADSGIEMPKSADSLSLKARPSPTSDT